MTHIVRFATPKGSGAVSLIRPRVFAEIDSYDLLVEAICRQAAKDLCGKNDYQRFDAMDFFRSEWFIMLAPDLDGEDIINKLLDWGRAKDGRKANQFKGGHHAEKL